MFNSFLCSPMKKLSWFIESGIPSFIDCLLFVRWDPVWVAAFLLILPILAQLNSSCFCFFLTRIGMVWLAVEITSLIYLTFAAAGLRVLAHLPLPYSVLSYLMIVPTPLRDAVYDHVAKKRYKWFGKSDDCLVLREQDLLDRFIDREELLERSRSVLWNAASMSMRVEVVIIRKYHLIFFWSCNYVVHP